MLGELVGIDGTPIHKYELGSRNPKPDQPLKIANALGVSISVFTYFDIETASDVLTLLFKMDEQINMEIDGEKDKDGNLRPLHIDKAVDVTKCEKPKYDIKPVGEKEKTACGTKQLLTKCDLFTVEEYIIDGTQRLFASDNSFVSLLVTDGCGTIESSGEKLEAHKGDSFFVFAGSGDIEINGKLNIISTKV